MKRFLAVFIVCMALPFAAFAATGVGDGIILEEQSTAPPDPEAGKVHLWVDNTSTPVLYMTDDASTDTAITAGSGDNTLDNAYDQGGAGAGKAITVDTGAIALSNTDADGNALLTINASPSSSAAAEGMVVTLGANATGAAIEVENSGSGYDFEGTGALATISKAGAISCASLSATSFSPSTLAVGGAGSFEGNLTLDDGSGDSPSLVLTNQGNESTTIVQNNTTNNLTLTPNDAAESVQVLTGNLVVGNGSPGTAAMDGEDFYCEGASEFDGAMEVDGALNVDGAADFDSTVDIAGTVALSEDVTFTMAADEEFTFDADTTAATGTGGIIDMNVKTGATNVKAIHIDLEADDTYANAYGVYVDVDDDGSGGEETIDCVYLANSAGTASTVNGIQLANTLDVGIDAVMGAAGQFAVVDATTTDQTQTSGVLDINFGTITNAAVACSIYTQVGDTQAGGVYSSYHTDLDDDTSTIWGLIRGYSATSNDLTGHASTLVQGFFTSGCDVAMQADNGYIRVGTGSTPGVTPGDDDVFIEGTLEVDGDFHPDGNITGDGATEMVGVRADTVVSSGATVAVTAATTGTRYYNDQATEFDLPADPTGLLYTFCVGNASNLVIDPNGTDRISGATDANGDSLTSSTVGDTITLIGTDADTWFVQSAYPASTDWPDTN